MSTDANRPQSNAGAAQPPMRAVARNPEAFAAHLANVQRVLLAMGRDLESLQEETQVVQRNTRVAGDRWYHARKRSRPTEKSLKSALNEMQRAIADLEKTAFARHAHDVEVKELPGKRKAKQLAKDQKRNRPVLPAGTGNPDAVPPGQNSVYAAPASIYDLGDRRSA